MAFRSSELKKKIALGLLLLILIGGCAKTPPCQGHDCWVDAFDGKSQLNLFSDSTPIDLGWQWLNCVTAGHLNCDSAVKTFHSIPTGKVGTLGLVQSKSECKKRLDAQWVRAFELEQQVDTMAYHAYELIDQQPYSIWDSTGKAIQDSLTQSCQEANQSKVESRFNQIEYRKGRVRLATVGCVQAIPIWLNDLQYQKDAAVIGAEQMLLAECYQRLGQRDSAQYFWRAQMLDNPLGYFAWIARDSLGIQFKGLANSWANSPLPGYRLDTLGLLTASDLMDRCLAHHSTCAQKWVNLAGPRVSDSVKVLWVRQARLAGHEALAFSWAKSWLNTRVPRQQMASLPIEALQELYPRNYQSWVMKWSKEYSVPAHLIWAIMRQESSFDSLARSPVGAMGLMQLMPKTASAVAQQLGLADFHVDSLVHPHWNIRLGTAYLKVLLAEHANPEYSIAHYNAGPAPAKRWEKQSLQVSKSEALELISFRETRDYVKKVSANWRVYDMIYPNKDEQK